MNTTKIQLISYWSWHIFRHAPPVLYKIAKLRLLKLLKSNKSSPTQILIGTHHKVLTVYFIRVFRVFAMATGRTISVGMGEDNDLSCDIVIDHHSRFPDTTITSGARGIHVTRDPRDLLISCVYYHQKSHEPWLHVPRNEFGGLTYQQYLRSLKTFEQQLLFELEHSAASNINDMIEWCEKEHRNFYEIKYEEIVGKPAPISELSLALRSLRLDTKETELLLSLFDYFSIGGAGAKGNPHIRKPAAGQWIEQMPEVVVEQFNQMFPNAVSILGYAQDPTKHD